ncbi:MAG: (2Fe-2S) ferredoxin domain-containing protein, partial [Proteobacteria bacterium]|nr:(2Fe-2S) ferredoxin domain-containing protein [Pseudomonadota bacterium]
MTEIFVGLGSCGIASGARQVYETLQEELTRRKLQISLSVTGCIGACHREPLIELRLDDGSRFLYGELDPEKTRRVVEEHLIGGNPVEEYLIPLDYPY